MKILMVCVRDRAADVFGTPTFVTTRGGAIRSFGDEVNNPREGNVLNKHPEDFDLYELGWYGDGDGHFELHPKPVQIAIGKDMVR